MAVAKYSLMLLKHISVLALAMTSLVACRSSQYVIEEDWPLNEQEETLRLEAPRNLDAVVLSPSTVKLIWESPESTVDYSIKIFVKQSSQPETQFTLVDTLNGIHTNYIVANLSSNVSYDFRTLATYQSTESNYSNTVSVMTFPIGQDQSAPVPYNVVATPELSAIQLNWQWSTAQTQLIHHLVIERRTLPGGNWGPAGASTYYTPVTTHTDTVVNSNNQFEYRIKVYYNNGIIHTSAVYGPFEPLPSILPTPQNLAISNFSQTVTHFSLDLSWAYPYSFQFVDYFHIQIEGFDYLTNQYSGAVSMVPTGDGLNTYQSVTWFKNTFNSNGSTNHKIFFKVQAASNNFSYDYSEFTDEVAVRCIGPNSATNCFVQ
jgi:hypothetical protein